MTWLSLVVAAVAPAVALLAYFYLKDRYVTEPLGMVARVFLFGVLIVFPIMILQRGLVLALGNNDFVFAFLISSGVEEFFKWFVVYFAIFSNSEFDEPYDGIVYAVAISMGFASFENILYLLLHPVDLSAIVIRALLPVTGHALFGVVMGYYFGKAKFTPSRRPMYVAAALLFPLFYHGLFDYILLKTTTYTLWWIVPLMAILWARSLWKVSRANEVSPFRSMPREEEVNFYSNGQ